MATFVRVVLAICLVILMCPAVWAGEVVVPFESTKATITASTDGTVSLSATGMATFSSPGNPALPFTSSYVLLPPSADVSTLCVEVRNGVEEAVPGSFSVKPVPKLMTYGDSKEVDYGTEGKSIVDGRDVSIYGTDAFFPSSNAILGNDSHLGPYLMVRVQFWPYKYNPVTGKLVRLVSGDVAITFETKADVSATISDKERSAFSSRLKNIVVNPAKAAEFYGLPTTISYNYLAPDNTLLILTTRDIWNSCWPKMMDFVAHKQARGWTLSIADDYTWAGGPSPGGDAAAELLRTYLQSQYANFRYLLLIGDPNPNTGLLPMKGTCFAYYPEENRGTDYYYADLTGNWDLNGDTIYGEGAAYPDGDFGVGGVDLVNEMIVGRIPYTGGAMSQIDTMLQKVIDYEDAATVGSWAQRMLLPMVPLDGATLSYQLGEQIRTNVLLPSGREYYRIYDDIYGLMPPREAGPNSDTATLTAWMNGYGFMFEQSHGIWQYALAVINALNCPYLPDTMPSHVMMASCQCADPLIGANVAFELMRCGAISVVAGSWNTYYASGTTDYTNGDCGGGYSYRYADNLARLKQRCGDAWWNTQLQVPLNMWPNHTRYNLLGDPTVAAQWPTSLSMVTTSPLPSITRNVYYRKDFFAAGGTTPYTWTRTAGTLPRGLSLNSTGYLSGTPSRTGTYSFTLRCTATGGAYVSRTFSLTVTN